MDKLVYLAFLDVVSIRNRSGYLSKNIWILFLFFPIIGRHNKNWTK